MGGPPLPPPRPVGGGGPPLPPPRPGDADPLPVPRVGPGAGGAPRPLALFVSVLLTSVYNAPVNVINAHGDNIAATQSLTTRN